MRDAGDHGRSNVTAMRMPLAWSLDSSCRTRVRGSGVMDPARVQGRKLGLLVGHSPYKNIMANMANRKR